MAEGGGSDGKLVLKKQVAIIQESLGKFVKKPPLLEKNLARPPFRFIHDVFMTVMETSGFFHGLFTPAEIDSSGLNSREEKTLFLQKCFDVITLVTGKELELKVSKVLAGQEPERTNEALIALAQALNSGQSSRKAVEMLTGVDPGDGQTKKDGKLDASKKDSKQNAAGAVAGLDKKGSNTNLAGNKGKQQSKAPATRSSPSNNDKKSKPAAGAEPVVSKAKPSQSTTNTKIKQPFNPYEKQSTKKPMKVPAAKGRTEEKVNNSRRGSSGTDVEPAGTGSRRASVSRSSSNQSISKVTTEKGKSSETVSKDDPQFMGEMESILQEHGIEVDPELELANADKPAVASRRSAAAAARKNSDPKLDPAAALKSSPEIEEELSNYELLQHEPIDDHPAEDEDIIPSSPSSPDLIHSNNVPPKTTQSATNLNATKLNLGSAKPAQKIPAKNSNQSVGKPAAEVTKAATSGQAIQEGSKTSATVRSKDSDSADQFFDTISNRPQTNRLNRGRPPSSAGAGAGSQPLRPVSARPAPPRPLTARLLLDNPADPFRPPTSSIPLILESEKLDDDDDEYMIAQEKATQGLFDTLGENLMVVRAGGGDDGGTEFSQFEPKGHLVHQIMETKRELETEHQLKSDFGGGGGDEDLMDKVRNATKIEMDKLKSLIQNTARVSNPIGKLLDYINEDIETMGIEFKKYKDEGKQLELELNRENEETRKESIPYTRTLRELDDQLDLQESDMMTAFTAVLSMEARFENIVAAIDKVDENEEREIPHKFMSLYSAGEVDLDELDEMLLKKEKELGKPYLLFGSHPWASPKAALQPRTQLKNPKNVMKQKKEFKMGMVPQEFYESGEEQEMVQVKPKKRFRLKGKPKAGASAGMLQPPKPQLDSLEILKMMELANEDERNKKEPEAGALVVDQDQDIK